MDSDVITSCLNLMRRMPPKNAENDLCGLVSLLPSETDELLQRIDQPLQEAVDPSNGRKYLLCDYNRDGDSYRSPWSNKYDPAIEDGEGFVPSTKLRELEVQANEIFDSYRNLYYQGGVSSVYMWDLEPGFAACFLVKKDVKGQRYVKDGSWNSIHVVEVQEDGRGNAVYKLTTTIMLNMNVDRKDVGDLNFSGNLTRQKERTFPIESMVTHISNMGRMVEDIEIEMRGSLDRLYIQKTQEIITGIRSTYKVPDQSMLVGELTGAVLKRGSPNKGRSDD